MAQLIIKQRLATVSMRHIVADGVAWSVCRSVTILSPAKTAEPIAMLFGGGLEWAQGTAAGSRSPMRMNDFEGDFICTADGWL